MCLERSNRVSIAVSHLEGCVLQRCNPIYEYTKCPQPKMKRDGLRRIGRKRKQDVSRSYANIFKASLNLKASHTI